MTPIPGGGEIRTYRGRTIDELVPRIRAELGPGAIILRERQGVTGGVAGFFAQRCVEVDAQAPPKVSVYADELDDVDGLDDVDEERELDDDEFLAASTPSSSSASVSLPELPPAPDVPALPAPGDTHAEVSEVRALASPTTAETLPFASFLEPSPAPAPAVDAPGPVAAPAPADEGPTKAVEVPTPTVEVLAAGAEVTATDAETLAPESGLVTFPSLDRKIDSEPGLARGFIDFEDLAPEPGPGHRPGPGPEPGRDPACEARPTAEPVRIPVAVQPAPAPGPAALMSSPFRVPATATAPAPAAAATPTAESTPTPSAGPFEPLTRAAAELRRALRASGFSDDFAERCVSEAETLAPTAERLPAAVMAGLLSVLPEPRPLPRSCGAIAVVGPGGSGKTRTVAALAAAWARAGRTVTVARLGASERGLELAELLQEESVEVIPTMRTHATARAVASARERELVIIDTPSVSTASAPAGAANGGSAVELLAETLAPFALDATLLCVPATYTGGAATRLADGFAPLHPTGLIATHADEADGLGAVAELSVVRGLPLGHAHAGLDVARAITECDPGRLVGGLVRAAPRPGVGPR